MSSQVIKFAMAELLLNLLFKSHGNINVTGSYTAIVSIPIQSYVAMVCYMYWLIIGSLDKT